MIIMFHFFECKKHKHFNWENEVLYHVCLKLFLDIRLLCNKFNCKKIVQEISRNDMFFLDVNDVIMKIMSWKNLSLLSEEIHEILELFQNNIKFSIMIFSCCANQEFFFVIERLRESYRAFKSEWTYILICCCSKSWSD